LYVFVHAAVEGAADTVLAAADGVAVEGAADTVLAAADGVAVAPVEQAAATTAAVTMNARNLDFNVILLHNPRGGPLDPPRDGAATIEHRQDDSRPSDQTDPPL
jgi:hypothetical protein